MSSNQIIDQVFKEAPSLKELAKEATFVRKIVKEHPGGMGGSIMGEYPRITSKTTKAAVWGGGENLTLSLLKTDVIDRRYVDKDHFDMQDLIDGAFSEANKDLNDMPLAGMTRPDFAVLDKRGGRYNHAIWSEVYPFPCQKPVGQIILKADSLEGAAQPEAVQHMNSGLVTVEVTKDDQKMDVHYLMSMEKNVTAMEVSFRNLKELPRLRLYRGLDQGHRRYENEDGSYKKYVVYRPADGDQPLEYYDFEADRDVNGHFEPPTCGADGRFFWVHQVFPAEPTFPEGFRYVMMSMISGAGSENVTYELAKGLGSMPHIPRDGQGVLKVPGIRTTTHPEMFEMMAENYSYVASAPGVAAEAQIMAAGADDAGAGPHADGPVYAGKFRVYTAVVTVNETPDYMEKAKELLLEAEKQGFEGLAAENECWYDALYEKREAGRILMGDQEEDRKKVQEIFLNEAYQSWTSGHMGYCSPDVTRYEGSASYACYDVDTQSWHSLPCYNELFTEGKYFMRNQYEPKRQWPALMTLWHDTMKEKAHLKFGLPGMYFAHGYLPAAKQSPWYVENGTLDFTIDVPVQIMKVVWNFWDYTGDEEFLRRTAYPLLKDLAVFYEAFARRGWDGKQFNLEPTVETEGYGSSYQLKYTRNNTGALCLTKWLLHTAVEAAEYLGVDQDLTAGWTEVAEHLAPYPTFMVGSGPVIGANEMAFPRFTRGDHFMFTGYYPVDLADEYNLDSPQEIKDMMTRTADALGTARNWESYVLTGSSADYIPRSYGKGAVRIDSYEMLAEDLLEAPERLMNSRSGRIHLFPAVPSWTKAAFRDFLARGGFSVSAARDEQGVLAVTVKASRSIPCRLMNPWPGQRVVVTDLTTGRQTAAADWAADRQTDCYMDISNGECIVFQAQKGHCYSIDKACEKDII